MMTTTVVRYSHARYQYRREVQPLCKERRKIGVRIKRPYTTSVISRIIAEVQDGNKVYVIRYHDASDNVRSIIYGENLLALTPTTRQSRCTLRIIPTVLP